MNVLSINPRNAMQATKHRKENSFRKEYSVVAKTETGFKVPLTLRIYGNSYNYACLWSNSIAPDVYFTGSGRITGGGFDMESECTEQAINSAGIKLDTPIGGRGNTAIEDALTAIAEHYGYFDFYIHKAHA